MSKDYYLCTGPNKKQYFHLPSKWVPEHFVESEDTELPSVARMALDALSQPAGTGAQPFRNLVSKAKNVAVIIDDGTRPTPAAEILQVLLPQIEDAGIPPEKTTIVVAIGTHDPMETNELKARVGADVASRYSVVQHDAWQADLVPVALPDDNRVVRINPAVARADFRISVSSILPHTMAGYGGGPKILMPGVSNFDFVREHHMTRETHPRSKAGITKGNPFHEDCMRVAQAIGLDFSINCVYNQQGGVIGIIGGSLEAAFAAAVKACEEKLGHRFPEKVDVTITSAYPHTHGVQFVKGFSAPDMITREAGAILMVAPLVESIPADFTDSFAAVREKSHNNCIPYLKEAMSRGCLFLPDKPLAFNQAMFCILFRPPIRSILVAPMVSPEQTAAMGMEHAGTIEEGLAALEKVYPQAKVAILPAGGLVVPVTEQKE